MRCCILAIVVSLSALSSGLLLAADQTGAEKTKTPASATIILKPGTKGDADFPTGNVQVTYTDGTRDLWTTSNKCSLARVSSNGTVGWTVHGDEVEAAASYKVRPNPRLVLNRKGVILSIITSDIPFITDWNFTADGKKLVISAMYLHGKSFYALHDATTGAKLEAAEDGQDKLPAWAKPFSTE